MKVTVYLQLFLNIQIKVTLNFNFERDDVVARKHKEKAIYKLTIKQKKILELLKGNGELTQKELSDKTSVSLAGVKKIMQKLQELNLISRRGAKKNGRWIVASRLK